MAYVNFGKKNTKAQALASDNPNKIFFPTDATSIIMGGKEYGIDTVTSINGKTGEITGELIHRVTSPSGTTGTKNVTRTQWTGTVNGITSLYTGLMIAIKVPNAGVNVGVTLDINNLGEHPVLYNITLLTAHYPVGSIVVLVYDADATASITISGVATEIEGCWKTADYDANTTYSAGTVAHLEAGNTSNRVWPASVLASYISSSTIPSSAKGANNGVAELDQNGKVPSSQLPASEAAVASGTDLSLVTTGEKAVWNAKQDALTNPVTGSSLTADKIVLGNGTTTVKTSSKGITATAPTSSSDDTTLPTSKAVWDAISTSLAASDAMVFRGTLGTNGTVTAVPTTNVVKGDTYKVITAGTWAGSTCKVGDLLIALASGNVTANTTNWAYVPSGDETVTTIATASSPNISSTAQSGAVTLGTVVTKAVETSLTNVDTAVPTSKAVKSFVEDKGYTTNTGTVTKVTAGTGLSIGSTSGGNFTTSGTINHTNSVTAQTTQAVYPIKIDAQGHISAYGNAIIPLTGVEAAAGANINSVGTPSVTAGTSGGVTTLTFDYLKGATGTAGADGSTIWTASAAPTSPNYTFAISALSSTPNTTPKVGDIVVYSYYRYTITSVSSSTVLTSYRQSIKGSSGAAATISIGTVTTGNAGTSATVTNSGTASAAVLDFVIPKGDPGTNATTTSVFSSSDNGLAPAASNANKTTAESSQSNYYLCADGKYRQLPITAFSDTKYEFNTAYNASTNKAATMADIPTTLPASDVSSWAKQSSKPTYIMSEVAAISAVAISANTSSSCSITGAGNAGKAETIIYTNSGSSDLTVTVPTTYQTPDGNAIELTCPAGGYCEVNYLNIGGTIYARGL